MTRAQHGKQDQDAPDGDAADARIDETLPDRLDDERTHFIESFASAWESQQGARMDGRVLGLLLISDEPYMSAARIASARERRLHHAAYRPRRPTALLQSRG